MVDERGKREEDDDQEEEAEMMEPMHSSASTPSWLKSESVGCFVLFSRLSDGWSGVERRGDALSFSLCHLVTVDLHPFHSLRPAFLPSSSLLVGYCESMDDCSSGIHHCVRRFDVLFQEIDPHLWNHLVCVAEGKEGKGSGAGKGRNSSRRTGTRSRTAKKLGMRTNERKKGEESIQAKLSLGIAQKERIPAFKKPNCNGMWFSRCREACCLSASVFALCSLPWHVARLVVVPLGVFVFSFSLHLHVQHALHLDSEMYSLMTIIS